MENTVKNKEITTRTTHSELKTSNIYINTTQSSLTTRWKSSQTLKQMSKKASEGKGQLFLKNMLDSLNYSCLLFNLGVIEL